MTKVSLRKLTYDYFYPDLCSDNIKFEVPSLEALVLIGDNNLYEISKSLDRTEQTLKSMIGTIDNERIAAQEVFYEDNVTHCDWHSAGYGKVLPVSKHKMMGHDIDAYEKQCKILQNEVFVCSFGRQLGKWCNEVLRNQSYLAYQNCLSRRLFYGEHCKLCGDQALFDAGIKHLRSLAKEYDAHLAFIKRYRQIIGQAYGYNTGDRPLLNITPSVYLGSLLVGTRMMRIYQYRGQCVVKRGLFLGIAIDSFGVPVAYIRMKGAKLIVLRLTDNQPSNALYLSETDYRYLQSDPTFRIVWQAVAKRFCNGEVAEVIDLMLKRADFE